MRYLKSYNDVEWNEFQRYPRPDFINDGVPSVKESRRYLKDYLLEREQRKYNLAQLLNLNGYAVNTEEISIKLISNFFVQNVSLNPSKEVLDERWCFYIWDASLYVGDYIINISKPYCRLNWKVKDVSIKRLNIQNRPKFVLSGFSSKVYEMAPDQLFFDIVRFLMGANPNDITSGGRFRPPEEQLLRAFQDVINSARI